MEFQSPDTSSSQEFILHELLERSHRRWLRWIRRGW